MKVRRLDQGEHVGVALQPAPPDRMVLVELSNGARMWAETAGHVDKGDALERTDWWEDRAELAAVMAAAIDAAVITTVKDALHFVQRPEAWNELREIWLSCRRPVHGEEGWDWFWRRAREEWP